MDCFYVGELSVNVSRCFFIMSGRSRQSMLHGHAMNAFYPLLVSGQDSSQGECNTASRDCATRWRPRRLRPSSRRFGNHGEVPRPPCGENPWRYFHFFFAPQGMGRTHVRPSTVCKRSQWRRTPVFQRQVCFVEIPRTQVPMRLYQTIPHGHVGDTPTSPPALSRTIHIRMALAVRP